MNDYIHDICSKASKRLFFQKTLQQTGNDAIHLVKVYCSPAPAPALVSLSLNIYVNRWRQFRTSVLNAKELSYSENTESTALMTPKNWRETLSRKIFNRSNRIRSNRIFNPLPSWSKHQYNLRNGRLPSIQAKTERFRSSFISGRICRYRL